MMPRPLNLLRGAALALLCLLLAACVEIQMRFDVRADGGGTAQWTVEIPKGSADSLGLTSEKVQAKVAEDPQFRKPGVKVTTGRAANGNETVTVAMPFTSVGELSSSDMGFEFQKAPDGKQCTLRINSRAQMVPVLVRAEVHMPGKVTGSNADRVEGSVAHFNNLFRADGAWVQSETGGFLSGTLLALLAGGVAAILVIAALLVWLSKRRRVAGAAPAAAAAEASRCPQCGTDNKPGAKFCRTCGGNLAPPVAPVPPPGVTHCPRCNVAVSPGKKFCASCGAPLVAAAPAPPPPLWEPPPAPPAPPPAWEPTPTPAPPAAPGWTAPPPQPAKSSAMMIALGASLVLLLLAIALLVYKLFFQERAAAPPTLPAQTATGAQPAAGAPAAAEPQPGAPVTPEPAAAAPAPTTQPAQTQATPSTAAPLGRPSPMPSISQPRTAPPAAPAWSPPQSAPPANPPAQSPPAEPQPAPVTPAPAAPAASAPAPRGQILRPEPTPVPSTPPAQPAYSGPRSGYVIWSGQLEREGLVEITGGRASAGTLRGELPGVPVVVELEPKDVGVAEAPSPQNGWKRLVLRSRNRRLSVVTVKWTVIQ